MAATLNNISGMPQMSTVLSGWENTISLKRVVQTISAGLPVLTTTTISFVGVIQPLNPESISLKAEGQRAWEWLQIHMTAGEPLNVNDIIVYNDKEFKVMAKRDYTLNGYIEYHVAKDFT